MKMLRSSSTFMGPLRELRSSKMTGLWGYILRRRFAQKLLDAVFPLSEQIDIAVGHTLSAQGGGYAVPLGQFLLYSEPFEIFMDSDAPPVSGSIIEACDMDDE